MYSLRGEESNCEADGELSASDGQRGPYLRSHLKREAEPFCEEVQVQQRQRPTVLHCLKR